MSAQWVLLAYIVSIVVVTIILAFAAVTVIRLGFKTSALDGLIAEPHSETTITTAVTAGVIAAGQDAPTPAVLAQTIQAIPSKASLSRFQFLLFTFVVAGLFLLLSIESGAFVEIPPTVLGLIGISGGSFIVSKGISNSK